MLYAGSNDELKKSLDGIAVEVQATDSDEVEYKSKHIVDLIYSTLFSHNFCSRPDQGQTGNSLMTLSFTTYHFE